MDDGDSRPDLPIGRADPSELRLVVEIVEDAGDWSAFGDVTKVVSAAAQLVAEAADLDFDRSTATVALSSDAIVRDLNRAYRGKDKPTNVLSFPAPPVPAAIPEQTAPLGDIILAAETVAGEARELGIQPAHHLQHLVVHGLLHLLGFDHETDEEALEMEALETRLLARIGIDDPYGGPAA